MSKDKSLYDQYNEDLEQADRDEQQEYDNYVSEEQDEG